MKLLFVTPFLPGFDIRDLIELTGECVSAPQTLDMLSSLYITIHIHVFSDLFLQKQVYVGTYIHTPDCKFAHL